MTLLAQQLHSKTMLFEQFQYSSELFIRVGYNFNYRPTREAELTSLYWGKGYI